MKYTDKELETALEQDLSQQRKSEILDGIQKESSAQELLSVLLHGNDPRAVQLAGYMSHKKGKVSLASACQKHGLTITDVVKMFQRYKVDEALVGALRHTGQIVEDTAVDAAAHWEYCKRCV